MLKFRRNDYNGLALFLIEKSEVILKFVKCRGLGDLLI